MLDLFTVWLSHVDPLLHLGASISVSLAKIFFSARVVLSCVLGMYMRVRTFRRGLTAVPVSRLEPAQEHRRGKRKPKIAAPRPNRPSDRLPP